MQPTNIMHLHLNPFKLFKYVPQPLIYMPFPLYCKIKNINLI